VSVQARPQDYAAAIYDLALEPWLRNLESVQKVVKSDAALRADLAGTGLSAREKLDRLSQALPAVVTGEVRKFLGTLLEAGQIDQLDTILLELDRLARRRPDARRDPKESSPSRRHPRRRRRRKKKGGKWSKGKGGCSLLAVILGFWPVLSSLTSDRAACFLKNPTLSNDPGFPDRSGNGQNLRVDRAVSRNRLNC